MTQNFDLLGDPIPENWGRRGRPQHIPTVENRNKVMLLQALGWSPERIAAALSITAPTLRRHYFRELKFRDEARARVDAALIARLYDDALAGNVGAAKEFYRHVERADLRALPKRPAATAQRLGKKEAALLAARAPDPSTALGELMAVRQGAMLN